MPLTESENFESYYSRKYKYDIILEIRTFPILKYSERD